MKFSVKKIKQLFDLQNICFDNFVKEGCQLFDFKFVYFY